MGNCKCSTLAQKLVGDGCEVCNPAMALDIEKEINSDLRAQLAAAQEENARLARELEESVCMLLDADAVTMSRAAELLGVRHMEARKVYERRTAKGELGGDGEEPTAPLAK